MSGAKKVSLRLFRSATAKLATLGGRSTLGTGARKRFCLDARDLAGVDAVSTRDRNVHA